MPPPTPLRRSWRTAPATLVIAAVTLAAWLIAFAVPWTGPVLVFVPERLGGLPGIDPLAWLTPLSTLFVHAGFLHLMLNMLALIVFGRATEPAVGTVGLVILYLVGAIASAAAFYFAHPIGLPWVGAGGGVGAVLGGYALLFGRNRRPQRQAGLAAWSYPLWLCAGWTALSLLVSYTFADAWAVYYAAAYAASFAAGLLLARPLLLLHYRKA